MKFEYPNVLYSLLLIAIPLIIHLFNFRKYKTIYFSSLFFIRQVNEETKSTQKLKHILILISRILAFTALIFAFAQPYLPIENEVKSGSPLIGIYVDNSFSMSLKGSDGELLSMAKEKARQIIKKASDDSKFLVVSNNFEGVEQRIISKQNAFDRIDKIEFSPIRKEISQVISWMKEGINDAKVGGFNFSIEQIVLLSDYQKNILNKRNNFADSSVYYYPIQLAPQKVSNVAIDSLWFTDPNFKVGINNELNVRLTNHSEEDFTNLELQLSVNRTKRSIFVDIEKNSEKVLKINYSDQETGIKSGQVQINDKQVVFDDDYYFSYQVNEKSTVLILDGPDAVPNISLVYGLDTYYQLESIPQNSFTPASITQKDLVIINGWEEFSSASVELLLEFLRSGGTLAVFPGRKIDLASYNSLMNKINSPTFSGLLTTSGKISRIAYEDPFFEGMFDKKPTKLNLPSQTKLYGMQRGFSSFLSLIELENGSSLFYKTLKPYNCFVFTSSLQDEFGNFKSNALFSSVLLRIAEMSQRRYPVSLTIGSDLTFPVYMKDNSESPLRLRSKELEFIPQVLKENDITSISIQKGMVQPNFKAGLFDILADKKIGSIALNYDREESKIAVATSSDVEDYFQQQGLKNVFYYTFSTNSDAALLKIEKPIEYWRLFLIFALVFLVIEMALLKWMK